MAALPDDMAPGDEAPDDAESTAENLCPTCSGSGRVNEAVGGG